LFAWRGNPDASSLTFVPSSLYYTFANLASLFVLHRLCRGEGIRLPDLLGPARGGRWPRELLFGLLWFLAPYVPFAARVMGVPLLVYGPGAFGQFQGIFAPAGDPWFGLPVWTAVLGLLVFPLINAPTEELHYRGYAQQRLVALGSRPWAAMLLVALGFGLQPLTRAPTALGGATFVVAFFLWGLGANVIYSRQQRLAPLIFAHYLCNFMVPLVLVATALLAR
jgi:membrane protease YdiL (CAAX protease family)